MDDQLRDELVAMRAEDLRVRQELMDAGELGGPYVPRMEGLHIRNAMRLKEIIALHGWPNQTKAGEDGAKAAWFIVQHAIGDPQFQRDTCNFFNRKREREMCLVGMRHIWKIESLCTRVGRNATEPNGSTIQQMAVPAHGNSKMKSA